MPTKYRDSNGEMLYIFSWWGGGGNHVHAPNIAVARKRAIAFGKGVADRYGKTYEQSFERSTTLVPNMGTLRAVNSFEEFNDFDRGLAMLAW